MPPRPLITLTSSMTREHDTGRSASLFTVPRALKSVIFVALLFAAITSSYLEHEAAAPPASGVDAAPGPAVPSSTSVPRRPKPAIPTTPPTVAPSAAAPPTIPNLAPAKRLRDLWRDKLSPEYVTFDAGCASDTSAAGLAAFFAQPLGPIYGFDGPRVYPLGDGRNLWMLQDTFIDYAGGQDSFAHMNYANSSALIQDGTCFTALQRGTTTDAQSFEQGTGTISFDHYYWPAGGMVTDGKLQMFWMEMVRDPEIGGPLDGLSLHPVKTWLATYDVASMQRLSFVPAPNPGVAPVYGYHVASDETWTYLFANSYQQNLALEGGYSNGPHSATKMYLARVPLGRLDATQQYWNGVGFVDQPTAAVPISSRYFTENSMIPQRFGGKWISATKVDGFLGTAVSIDIADDPWGPYTTVKLLPATPRGSPDSVVTYHAFILPWLDPSGGLIVSLSQIPLALGATDAPPRYRPNFWLISL